MKRSRASMLFVVLCLLGTDTFAQDVTKYVRYAHEGSVDYGILKEEMIHQLRGSIFESAEPTGRTIPLSEARLLVPCEPSKVIAVGLNYRSHLGDTPVPQAPRLFAKFPTSLIGTGDDIIFPPGAADVHYEGEMVVVIGKTASRVSVEDASDYIFGVTIGNDVSERIWQANDISFLRPKASDGFGPMGPAIVQGLDYNDLLLQTRVNGEVRQSQRTSDLLFGVYEILSYLSQYVTLIPGDVIFTGTPGATMAMQPGEMVEIELEGVGILQNRVAGFK